MVIYVIVWFLESLIFAMFITVGRYKCSAVEKHVYYFDYIVVRFQSLSGVWVLLKNSMIKLGLLI